MSKPNATEVKNTYETSKFPANKKITALLETLQITERLNPLQKAQPFFRVKKHSRTSNSPWMVSWEFPQNYK